MDIVKAENIFIQKMTSKNWSIETIKNYKSQVNCFLKEFKSKPRALEINANEIELYLLNKVNINTRKHARCAINAFYKLVVNQPNKLIEFRFLKKKED